MSILIDQSKRVLVQGITGREGRARTRLMRCDGSSQRWPDTFAEFHVLFLVLASAE